jgi:hypothetical protein
MELIASQETGIVMFHLRDDVLCWFWFLDYFKKPENRHFRFFEQKIRIKELLVPVISKT